MLIFLLVKLVSESLSCFHPEAVTGAKESV